MTRPPRVFEAVPLAPFTTLEVGGPARYFAEVGDRAELPPLLAWAREQRLPTLVLGGGSNLLIADAGFDGLALRFAERSVKRGLTATVRDGELRVEAEAGMLWDDLVATCVARGATGIECLSGIPGRVGAAPVQNIGAYGQEVADTLRAVHVIERATGEERHLEAAACGFGYRRSLFREEGRDRYVVIGVEFGLRLGAPRVPTHAQLRDRLGSPTHGPSVTDIRDQVLAIRREKSMLHDPTDPNHRSVGSFFLNPVVTVERADEIAQRAGNEQDLPRYPADAGFVKLSAAWLIERAGFEPGYGEGSVGLSTRHSLAIINRGGARAAEILAFARTIQAQVRDAFSVTLELEPLVVGEIA